MCKEDENRNTFQANHRDNKKGSFCYNASEKCYIDSKEGVNVYIGCVVLTWKGEETGSYGDTGAAFWQGDQVAILKASGVGLRAVGLSNFLQLNWLAAEGSVVRPMLWGVLRREREGGFPSCLPRFIGWMTALEERSRPLNLDLAWIRGKVSAIFQMENEIRNRIAWSVICYS